MHKDQKLKIIELSDKNITQKKIAEEIGATTKEVRAFLKEFRENPAAITLSLVEESKTVSPPEEPKLPTIMDLITEEIGQSGKKSKVVIMNEAVAKIPHKRSSNNSRYQDCIFKPK